MLRNARTDINAEGKAAPITELAFAMRLLDTKKKFLAFVLLVTSGELSVAEGDKSSERPSPVTPERITIYSVPLRCPLVEGLGCGSMAKPVLSELERNSSVAEAWLDHSGTKLALVWRIGADTSKRAEVLAAAAKTTELEELSGVAREGALKDIAAGPRWYRAGDVDLLSSEEAENVTGRLLERIEAVEPLSKPARDLLTASFSDTLKRRFIQDRMSDKETSDELLKAARQHVGAKGIEALEKVSARRAAADPNNRPATQSAHVYTLLPVHLSFWRTTLKKETSGKTASSRCCFALRIVTVPRVLRFRCAPLRMTEPRGLNRLPALGFVRENFS